jgi:hypothetical protein
MHQCTGVIDVDVTLRCEMTRIECNIGDDLSQLAGLMIYVHDEYPFIRPRGLLVALCC